jgi:hypothetical protein
MKRLLFLAALALAAPVYAQNAPSGSPRVQGTPDGYGDPVQVTVVTANGSSPTGTSADQVQGATTNQTALSTNPVAIGCIMDNAPAAVGSAGTISYCKVDSRGYLWAGLGTGGSSAILNTGTSDATANSGAIVQSASRSLVFNGTTFDRQKGDTNGTSIQYGLTATHWNYAAAASGIVNTTTAVTIKAAAGASIRNYVCSLQISHDTLGAVTEFAIRDGAAGTVLWRGKLQTTATDISGGAGSITFPVCLRGTANTLLEVVTLTAVTGGVYVNAQGYTGS